MIARNGSEDLDVDKGFQYAGGAINGEPVRVLTVSGSRLSNSGTGIPRGGLEQCRMAEISRILTAGGLVAASSGLVIYGIGAAFVEPHELEITLGLWAMIIGVLAAAAGIIISKRIVEED